MWCSYAFDTNFLQYTCSIHAHGQTLIVYLLSLNITESINTCSVIHESSNQSRVCGYPTATITSSSKFSKGFSFSFQILVSWITSHFIDTGDTNSAGRRPSQIMNFRVSDCEIFLGRLYLAIALALCIARFYLS